MKDKQKKQKILDVLDRLVAAMTITAGIMNFTMSGDWRWIGWVVIVIAPYLRVWMVLDAQRRAEEKAETYFKLYNRASMDLMDLAWENEQIREKHTGEDEG